MEIFNRNKNYGLKLDLVDDSKLVVEKGFVEFVEIRHRHFSSRPPTCPKCQIDADMQIAALTALRGS